MKRLMMVCGAVVVVAGAAVAAIVATGGWKRIQGLAAGAETHAGAFCHEHSVPEKFCTLCHEELKSQLLMCQEHGLPEEICTLCHPEAQRKYGLKMICKDHGLPQHFCVQCNSGLPAAGRGGGEMPLVRLASKRTAADAGIEVAAVQSTEHTQTLICNGEVAYNQNRYAKVRPRVEGIVRQVKVDVGQEVRAGDVLAVVDSAALGSAKADYLAAEALVELAEKNLARLRPLADQGIAAAKTLLEAESRLKEAQIAASRHRQTLLNLGFNAQQIDSAVQRQDASSLLALTAPFEAVVVDRNAVEGEAVGATTELFAIAALSTMWVYLDVYEKDLPHVREGQAVAFTAPGLAYGNVPGRVNWVSTEVNRRTRTVRVRAEVENPGNSLRANMFGKGTIRLGEPHPALMVPKEAVQVHQDHTIVFVKKSAQVFEPRRVTVSHREGPLCEIKTGLKGGEQVVTIGSFLFKTELNRGAIGAGCCE